MSTPTSSATELLRLAAALLSAVAACGDDTPTRPQDGGVDAADADASIDALDAPVKMKCPIGDLSQPIELETGYFEPSIGDYAPFTDGSVMTIADSQQGFWIVRPGLRVRNIDVCATYQLTTGLRDTCADQLLSVDSRTVIFRDSHDGWAVPYNLSYFGQLHMCPIASPPRDTHDLPYHVQMILDDGMGRTAQAMITIIPTCPETDKDLCLCNCDRDFTLGVGGTCPPATETGPGPTCPP